MQGLPRSGAGGVWSRQRLELQDLHGDWPGWRAARRIVFDRTETSQGCGRTDVQHPIRAKEDGPSHSDEWALVAFRSPKSRATLIVASLISLGLWAAIWLVLRTFVSALAGSSFSWQKILATTIIAITISVVVIRFRQRQSS
jgi:hypothetical protein